MKEDEELPQVKCWYHLQDWDGKCSAAIVKMFTGATLYKINNGWKFPFEEVGKNDVVYMVDFSLPMEDMIKLAFSCAGLIWIDHHASTIKDYKERWGDFPVTMSTYLQEGTAACVLTWDWFHGHKIPASIDTHIPDGILLLGAYDVWKWQNVEGAIEFQYGMRDVREDTEPTNLDFWGKIVNITRHPIIDEIIAIGKPVYDYEMKHAAAYCNLSFEIVFEGLRCIVVNRAMMNSIFFKSVYDPEKHDAMMGFFRDKHQWRVTMYTDKPNIDLSVVCKLHGGGGHPQAAGFQLKSFPSFLDIEVV
jgi:oligoribonuclease NrnB/cAMP/cGMP phosphodiesterase (DHH superfamily)